MLCSIKDHGQGMVEYAMILMLIAIVVIYAVSQLGVVTLGLYNKINAAI